jgi:hypothetical protein
MNLPQLLKEANEIQNIISYLKNYKGSDAELLRAKQQYVTTFLESMANGLTQRPLFSSRPDRRFKATALQISSLEEPEEPEEEEEDEGTTNEEKENCASRD